MKGVIIISQGEKNTGINKYAINTYNAMDGYAELFFIKFRMNQGFYDFGNIIDGRFQYGDSILNLNSLFPKISYSKFVKFLKKQKISNKILHVASPHVLNLIPGFDNIVTIHDLVPLTNYHSDGIEYLIMRKFYKHYLKYRNILTVSDHVKKMIIDMGVEGKVDHIYPYVSDNFFQMNQKVNLRKKYGLPEDKKLILSVSSNIKRKNLKLLPEMLSILGSEYKLVRVGERIGASYSFKLRDEKEMNEIYNACDVLVSPSIYEGFGYPVVEGLKSGISLAVSDIPVHREIADRYAVYFDPSSAKDSAKAVREALDSQDKNCCIPVNWMTKFSLNTFKIHIKNYYNNIEKKD